jgi:RecB family endonuclease NucS
VGLELKFPKATQKDAKQLIGYAEGIQKHEHEENFRGIMVAPEIPDGLKDLLKEHELEYKEVPWNDEDNNIEEEKNSDVDIDRTIISKNEDTPVDASLD